MAAQLLATYNAAMECYRRAMVGGQTFDGRRENLNQATKLSRTWVCTAGCPEQASRQGTAEDNGPARPCLRGWAGPWLEPSSDRGVGIMQKWRNNPTQSRLPRSLAMHLSARCGARTRNGSPCRSPAMANGRCRMHGGKSPSAPIGNANARKHGRYSAEAIAHRRKVAGPIRAMRELVEEVGRLE